MANDGGISFVVEARDDAVELVESEALVGGGLLADVGAMHHLEDLVVVDSVLDLLCDGLQFLEVNDSVLVLVENGEGLSQAVLGLGLSDARGNDVNELFKVDGTVLILKSQDDREDEGVSAVETELLKNFADFLGVNGSTAVLIENLEGLLELVVVFGGEAILPLSGNGF